jgi:hypothetical protein
LNLHLIALLAIVDTVSASSSTAVLIGLLFCFDLTFFILQESRGRERERDKTYTMGVLLQPLGLSLRPYDGSDGLRMQWMEWDGIEIWPTSVTGSKTEQNSYSWVEREIEGWDI